MRKMQGIADISGKPVTLRTAVAEGLISMNRGTYRILKSGRAPKGDLLEASRLAAIMAVKKTYEIIPHCHPIPVDSIRVFFRFDDKGYSLSVRVEVVSRSRTGVEMEALTGACVACLTVYDMLKYKQRDMLVKSVRLLKKTGGKRDFSLDSRRGAAI